MWYLALWDGAWRVRCCHAYSVDSLEAKTTPFLFQDLLNEEYANYAMRISSGHNWHILTSLYYQQSHTPFDQNANGGQMVPKEVYIVNVYDVMSRWATSKMGAI